ncbi:MAG: hypothetical protein J6C39_01990 [Clostridia bacterium]|nr:hypothetical protein [Clostridia bacterium]MBO5206325.1 hypothetical protein [Clostridia bacterium]MBP3583943.1 hypothetical protein [Clostridia bacterium]MBQ8583532.1 hypothetical protein [Clostridia bacterium]
MATDKNRRDRDIYEPARISISLIECPDIITASPTASDNVSSNGWTSGDW